jgi:hypothetical protein
VREWNLPLPEKVKLLPVRHVTLDWNPAGHAPDDVYDKPHFDLHFYFISEKTRHRITCREADAAVCTRAPSPGEIPEDYDPTPAGEPRMGWHWVDLLATEFNGGKFTRTYIYGYYNGMMIFTEPMMARGYSPRRPA